MLRAALIAELAAIAIVFSVAFLLIAGGYIGKHSGKVEIIKACQDQGYFKAGLLAFECKQLRRRTMRDTEISLFDVSGNS